MNYIKTPQELAKIRKAGSILGMVLTTLKKEIKAGMTPREVDARAEALIRGEGAVPGFLNYQPTGAHDPFPNTICASRNDVIVHGVPDDIPLKDGDIFSVDCGVVWQGYNADAAFTVIVGGAEKARSEKEKNLVAVTKKALAKGIAAAREGNTVGDISHAIGTYINRNDLKVVRGGLTGHGIGKDLHEDPSIYNEGEPGTGEPLKAGMALAIEPMVAIGSHNIVQAEDEGYATADGSPAAHFEHTIIITKDEAEVVTKQEEA